MQLMGIDIGGTGIKGAIVDADEGALVTDRFRVPTPHPASPKAVAATVVEVVQHFEWKGSVGCTFPGVVKKGVVLSAANVDKAWIGADAASTIGDAADCDVTVINDADAAGIAEMRHGAGVGVEGQVIVLTLGTGIGSAVFVDGVLVPNTELGHLELRGKDAEKRASNSVREEKELSWSKWADRVNEYLHLVEALLSPDLFIIGGGVSKKSDKFFPHLDVDTPMVTAQLLNQAGIVGAAMAAEGP
jgi:polyphosphate glucokinase